ncbi:hypothetical protein NL676_039090 [Syzygium grande]|nr:hypothetical protein NL676_039090 [Syzygium grande]
MEAQRQRCRRDLVSDQEVEKKVCSLCLLFVLAEAAAFMTGLLIYAPGSLEAYSVTVSVASLSLSLPSSAAAAAAAAAPVPSPSVVSGNWSVALSVKNRMRWRRLGWDHPQVMLFYGHEFVAGAFLERFSVAPRGKGTLETGVAAFSRDVGEWAARAVGTDGGDGGVMELAVRLLRHDDRSPDWLGWDSFDCHGLKVGFSSRNQSQVGLLLSGSPRKCT